MTESDSPLPIVEEWSRKSVDRLSCQSGDSLFSVVPKAFEAVTLYLKKDVDAFRRALACLKCELSNSKYDQKRDEALHDLFRGLLQSLQFTLHQSMAIMDKKNVFDYSEVKIVETWFRKSRAIYFNSSEPLMSVITDAFRAVAAFLGRNTNELENAMDRLESEWNDSIKEDKERDVPLRSLTYGLLQSLLFTLKESKKIRAEQFQQVNQVVTKPLENKSGDSDKSAAVPINPSIDRPNVKGYVLIPGEDPDSDDSIDDEEEDEDEEEEDEDEEEEDEDEEENEDQQSDDEPPAKKVRSIVERGAMREMRKIQKYYDQDY